MNILLIEDTNEEAIIIKDELKHDHTVYILPGQVSIRYLTFIHKYDLIIINYLFCKEDKISLCKAIRAFDTHIPILVLARTHDIGFKVHTLDSGADDFIVKPFAPSELRARVRALLRRRKRYPLFHLLKISNLTLNTVTKKARRGVTDLDLRPKEIMILEYLMKNAGRVITRGMILEHVWHGKYEMYENVVDVHMKHLRDKIDKRYRRKLIKTVYGFGYKME